MNLQEQIDRIYATYRPPWQPEPRHSTRFGPHVRPMLEAEFGAGAIHPWVLPQFPIREPDNEVLAATIPPDMVPAVWAPAVRECADYVAMTSDCGRVIFVDCGCQYLRDSMVQRHYFEYAEEYGFAACLKGVVSLFRHVDHKRELFVLLYLLQTMGLLRLPADLMTEMARPRPREVAELARGIEVVAPAGIEVVRYEIDQRVLGVEAAC